MVKITFAINILLIAIKKKTLSTTLYNHSDNITNIDNIERYYVIFKISVV